MSHSSAVVALALGLVVAACGDAEAPAAESPAAGAPAAGSPEESAAGDDEGELSQGEESLPGPRLQLRIDGREPMNAQARVAVQEGSRAVHLQITGGDDDSNLLMMDLLFDGVANTMGEHALAFGLPRQGDHVANASLDGDWYYSQGGDIDVKLTSDGTIEGRFDLALAPDRLESPGEAPVFVVTDEATEVRGAFSGDWILSCQSHLAGHDSLILGGEFCDNLQF